MAFDSPVRRAAKRVLAPLLTEGVYRRVQSVSMARDIRSGALTEPELALVQPGVRAGEVVLDLGANYGMWTYPLDRAVGASGRVYAFEPIPFTVQALRDVARLLRLRNTEIVPKGVGQHAGTLAFTVPLQDSGAISAGQAHAAARDDARDGAEQHVRWSRTSQVEVEVVRLDDVIPTAADVSFVKADIEGAELSAFRGATAIIERCHPSVVCEINPWFLEGFGLTVDDLLGFFAQRGYELYRIAGGRLVAVGGPAEVDEDNYLFVHPDRRARFATLI